MTVTGSARCRDWSHTPSRARSIPLRDSEKNGLRLKNAWATPNPTNLLPTIASNTDVHHIEPGRFEWRVSGLGCADWSPVVTE
jgi:hypothetical protein